MNDEGLNKKELRAIELIRESLGTLAADRAKLVLLRERARQVFPVEKQDVEKAIAYLGGNLTLQKGFGPIHFLARKYVLEDPFRKHRFKTYLEGLLGTTAEPARSAKKTRKKK